MGLRIGAARNRVLESDSILEGDLAGCWRRHFPPPNVYPHLVCRQVIMTLPTLDLSLYTHGNALQRQELASRLLDSLSEHGFVKLVGHGVSDERIGELFRWVSWSRL